MKKLRLTFLLTCCMAFAGFGQHKVDTTIPESIIKFTDLMVSYNGTLVDDENTSNGHGLGIAGFIRFPFDNGLEPRFGLAYNRTTQFKNLMYARDNYFLTDVKYQLGFFSLPIMLRYNMGEFTQFFVEAGGFVSLSAHSRSRGTEHFEQFNETTGEVENYTRDFKGEAGNRNNYGFQLGLGLKFPVNAHKAYVRLGYHHGFNDLYPFEQYLYNRYFNISVGFEKNGKLDFEWLEDLLGL